MAWIEIKNPKDNPEVLAAMMAQRHLYPKEYGQSDPNSRLPPAVANDNIVLSHSLIPAALEHAFSTFGALTSPDLPLSRRDHEMIAATVSTLNSCFY
jgi:hypothetical protein